MSSHPRGSGDGVVRVTCHLAAWLPVPQAHPRQTDSPGGARGTLRPARKVLRTKGPLTAEREGSVPAAFQVAAEMSHDLHLLGLPPGTAAHWGARPVNSVAGRRRRRQDQAPQTTAPAVGAPSPTCRLSRPSCGEARVAGAEDDPGRSICPERATREESTRGDQMVSGWAPRE